MLIFMKYSYRTDLGSRGFRLLWDREKSINVDKLQIYMRRYAALKEKIIAIAPDAASYYGR